MDQQQKNTDGSVTVILSYPIENAGREVDEITLRRPSVGDLMAAEKGAGNIEQSIILAAAVSGLPMAAIKRLDVADYQAVEEVLQGFLLRKA